MHLYKNCSDLPIWNFNAIKESNDFRYLVVGYDGYKDIEVPKGANERWQEIRNEWVKLIDDNEVAYYYSLVLEVIYLQTRYNVVKTWLNEMFNRPDMEGETLDLYIKMLKEWKYKWNKKAHKFDNIQRLLKQLKMSQNKISLKLSELEDLKAKYDNEGGDDLSIERQRIIINKSTGFNIDLKTDSVKTWVEACKMHQQIVEQRNRTNGK